MCFRYFGNIDISVTCAAFVVAMALLVQKESPRFSQLSSTMFGLFYCGYLPCFWVKLRCGLAAPSLNTGKQAPSFYISQTKAVDFSSPFNFFLITGIGRTWPILLGGQAHWTVGLVATLISFSGVIATDTFAFLGGKVKR